MAPASRTDVMVAALELLRLLGLSAADVGDLAAIVAAVESVSVVAAEERRAAVAVVAFFEPAMRPGETFAEACDEIRTWPGDGWLAIADRLAAAAAILGLS